MELHNIVGSIYTCHDVEGFRSIRRAVMSNTWNRLHAMEANGHVVTTDDFRDVLESEWRRAKQAALACEMGQEVGQEI